MMESRYSKVNTTVDIILSRGSDAVSITVPVNPPLLSFARSGANEVTEVVGLGEIVIPRKGKLKTFPIESWFEDYKYIEFFENAWEELKPLNFKVIGLKYQPMQVVINNFNCESRAGEEADYYYTLELIEYRPYGAKLVETPQMQTTEENTILPTVSERIDNAPPTPQTYTIKSGDCLWNIAKQLSNQGGANWKDLYSIPENKEIIGNNPNLIYPGQVLIVPEAWVT